MDGYLIWLPHFFWISNYRIDWCYLVSFPCFYWFSGFWIKWIVISLSIIIFFIFQITEVVSSSAWPPLCFARPCYVVACYIFGEVWLWWFHRYGTFKKIQADAAQERTVIRLRGRESTTGRCHVPAIAFPRALTRQSQGNNGNHQIVILLSLLPGWSGCLKLFFVAAAPGVGSLVLVLVQWRLYNLKHVNMS